LEGQPLDSEDITKVNSTRTGSRILRKESKLSQRRLIQTFSKINRFQKTQRILNISSGMTLTVFTILKVGILQIGESRAMN
jgi:CHASE2 domain-containing sensor protein